ncbi:retrovirus-related pol polyprotein from transposon TNT 1-94 [Tanacetum coccineum]
MAAVEVPQTLKYKGDQLNAAPILRVENFTNWKKRFICHIISIEPQFKNIILNDPYIPMAASQRKPETQWTPEERKAANLDQRLKSLIMCVLLDDQMNSDFQDNPDDQEDIKSNHEYLKDLEEEYQARALLAKSKRFFKKGTQRFSSIKATDQNECHKCGKKGNFARDCWSKTSVPSYQSPFQPKLLHSSKHKPKPRETKDFEAKYNKVKAKLALINSSTSAPCSSDENEVTEVKALTTLNNEERISVSKESSSNGEWVKISIQMVHTLLEMEDNDDRKSFLDYLCIDQNYVKEQRNNLMSKHRNLVEELNTCKEQLLVLNQAKLDLLTMQHVNTEILKENQNLRNELKELISITEAWLNNSNKVSIFGSNKPKLSEAEDSTLLNHDTGKLMNLQSVAPPSSTGEADWKREALQAKKVESFKASKTESSSALRSKTPTKRLNKLERGILINKEKNVNDMLRMYDKIDSSVNTPIMPPNMLGPDLNGKAVNESQYRGMIGPLMNLITSRPNIQFSTALCNTSSKHNESDLLSIENFQVSKWYSQSWSSVSKTFRS